MDKKPTCLLNKQSRESGIELLRIFAMFGIVYMHTFGPFLSSEAKSLQIHAVIINSMFNAGVSCFILISGYFGVSFSVRKVFRLECEVIFYSLLSFVIISFLGNETLSIRELAKSCLPIY